MKYWLFGFFLLWSGLLPGQHTRWAVGPEIGTGYAYQGCCSDAWGFHTFGSVAEYRLLRHVSIETNLRYTAMESGLLNYSSGRRYSFGGHQRLRGLGLTVGPRFNLPLRHALEIGAGIRAGVMPAWVRQEITNNYLPYQNRRYKASLVAMLVLEARLAWWFAEGMAVECSMGHWFTRPFNRELRLKSETGTPFPPEIASSAFLADFFKSLREDALRTGAYTIGMGFRFRL